MSSHCPNNERRFADCKCVWNPEEPGPYYLAEKISGRGDQRKRFQPSHLWPASVPFRVLGREGHNKNEIAFPGSPNLCLPAGGRTGELHNLSFEFWKKYRPPVNRKYKEGVSEIDITLLYKDGITFIEAKYLAPVSLRTTNDVRRDQIIRYLDLASYHFLNHPDRVKEFYFVLIIDTDRPPWILTRYKSSRNLAKGLTHHGLFPVNEDIANLLSKGIGWLSWSQVKKILGVNKLQFRTPVERRFVEDLIVYLDYKIREAERIRTERKQLSFW